MFLMLQKYRRLFSRMKQRAAMIQNKAEWTMYGLCAGEKTGGTGTYSGSFNCTETRIRFSLIALACQLVVGAFLYPKTRLLKVIGFALCIISTMSEANGEF